MIIAQLHAVLLLFAAVSSNAEVVTVNFPTSSSTPTNAVLSTTTTPYGTCFCPECEANYKNSYTVKHSQTEFCSSGAVILGRINRRTNHSEAAGIWLSEQHTPLSTPSRRGEHYEYSVRVLQVYNNPGPVKISLGDKITIRALRFGICPECENKVENLEGKTIDQRYLQPKEKYFFFIPTLAEGYGAKVEGFLNECSRVWEYRKLDDPGIPNSVRAKRYLLHSADCDTCVVSGCFQDKCVPPEEAESCNARNEIYFTEMWLQNSCQPLMDLGICHYNVKQGKCMWTSVTEDSMKSRKPIRECLDSEE